MLRAIPRPADAPRRPRPASAATPAADALRADVLARLSGLAGDARGRVAYALEGRALRVAGSGRLGTPDLLAVVALARWLAAERAAAYAAR